MWHRKLQTREPLKSAAETATTDAPKKRIGVPTKRVEPGGQKEVGDKINVTSVQVIGNGRIDDIATSPDGKRFAVLTPF